MTEREKLLQLIKAGHEKASDYFHKEAMAILKQGKSYNSKDRTKTFDEFVADALIENGIGDIGELTAENDKLRARLDNAVELPTMSEFKIVDLHTNFYQISYAVLYKSNGNLYIYQCFDKDKAEAKLKEIGGEK